MQERQSRHNPCSIRAIGQPANVTNSLFTAGRRAACVILTGNCHAVAVDAHDRRGTVAIVAAGGVRSQFSVGRSALGAMCLLITACLAARVACLAGCRHHAADRAMNRRRTVAVIHIGNMRRKFAVGRAADCASRLVLTRRRTTQVVLLGGRCNNTANNTADLRQAGTVILVWGVRG